MQLLWSNPTVLSFQPFQIWMHASTSNFSNIRNHGLKHAQGPWQHGRSEELHLFCAETYSWHLDSGSDIVLPHDLDQTVPFHFAFLPALKARKQGDLSPALDAATCPTSDQKSISWWLDLYTYICIYVKSNWKTSAVPPTFKVWLSDHLQSFWGVHPIEESHSCKARWAPRRQVWKSHTHHESASFSCAGRDVRKAIDGITHAVCPVPSQFQRELSDPGRTRAGPRGGQLQRHCRLFPVVLPTLEKPSRHTSSWLEGGHR